MSDFYVYRCYDAEDRLIYVGQSGNVDQRIKIHRRGPVGVSMVRHDVTGPYPTREAALTAEARVIASEKPLLNQRCNIERLYDEPTAEELQAAVKNLFGARAS